MDFFCFSCFPHGGATDIVFATVLHTHTVADGRFPRKINLKNHPGRINEMLIIKTSHLVNDCYSKDNGVDGNKEEQDRDEKKYDNAEDDDDDGWVT